MNNLPCFTSFKYKVGEMVYTFWHDDKAKWAGEGKIISRKFHIKYLNKQKDTAYLKKEYEWIHYSKEVGEVCLLITEDHIFKDIENAKIARDEFYKKIEELINRKMEDQL